MATLCTVQAATTLSSLPNAPAVSSCRDSPGLASPSGNQRSEKYNGDGSHCAGSSWGGVQVIGNLEGAVVNNGNKLQGGLEARLKEVEMGGYLRMMHWYEACLCFWALSPWQPFC